MNLRHQRMLDIRNHFLSHSSVKGSLVFLLAPGCSHPATGDEVTNHHYAVAKRQFLHPEFTCWLFDVVIALSSRLDADLQTLCRGLGSKYLTDGETRELDTGHDDFKWTIPTAAPPTSKVDNARGWSIRAALQSTVYFGASVTAAIALLPYISDFFITAYVIGAFAAVWFAARKRKEILSFSDGAELGFRSGFYGLLAASAIYDVVWQFFHYELWQIRNADRMLNIFVGMLHDAFSPSVWFMITFQIVITAIFAGSIGAPAGILAVKIFQRRVVE